MGWFKIKDSMKIKLIQRNVKQLMVFFVLLLVSENIKAQGNLTMAYPFELQDQYSNLVRMDDFKGKVVVLHFWFKGCAPCMLLAEPMAQMRKYYKDNPEVVFIDINLDEDTNTWLNAIREGGVVFKKKHFYTDSLSISLSTAPASFKNPLTAFYGIKGVPNLIIVGKKGEILERNPPRPLPKKDGIESVASLQFKQIINAYLLNLKM